DGAAELGDADELVERLRDVQLSLLQPALRRGLRDPAERGDEGLAGAESDGLIEERGGSEDARLDLARRDLFAILQLEEPVDAAEKLEAIPGPLAEVTAAQPAVVEYARGLLGAIAVAAHHLRAADQDLAAVGEALDGIQLHR